MGKWLGGVLLLLVLAITACEMAGWPFMRLPLQHFLENTLHRKVRIERPFHLQLFGAIRLQVGQLQISAPEGFSVPFLVDAHGLDLGLRYRDLWYLREGEAYLIQAIRADRLDAHMVRHANGDASWDFALDDTSPPRPFPMIEVLAVNQGQAWVKDAVTDANLTATFYTEEGAHLKHPESRMKVTGDFRHLPLKAELVTQGFLPVATQDKDSAPIQSSGWLTYGSVSLRFNGAVYDLFGEQRVKGKLHASGPSLADVGDLFDLALPRTPAFKVTADVEKGTDLWQVNVNSAHIGRSRLSGQFSYAYGAQVPTLKGKLQGSLLMLADLAPAFGAPGAAPSKKPTRVFPDESLDFDTYGRMNADIQIHLDAVDLGQAFRERISPLDLHLSLLDNKLALSRLEAHTAQGSLTGGLVIDAHAPAGNRQKPDSRPLPDWDIQLAVHDIRLEKWIKASPASQPANPQKAAAKAPTPYISGILNGKARLQGKGRSTAALLNTLDGQLALMVRDGEISHLVVEAAGLDIAQSVGLLLRGDQPLPMQCAVMGWHARQGVLTPEAALIDTPVTTVYVQGNMHLGQEQFNLKLQASPKNFSPFTVRSPILVTGPFIDPQVSISPGPVAARVAGGVLLALLNPFAAILPFLDPGDSGASSGTGCEQTLQQLKSGKKQK